MRKQYLVVLLMGLLLSACLTDKKIARNCNRFLEVCGVPQNETTLKDTTVNIDQMVVIPISPDSVKWDGEVSVKNGLAQLPPVEMRGKVISTTFSIVGGRLQVSS
ncbi:MAG: hypothetical protein J0653_02635, partial [Deltaproteobacteria bacterium]|nr:hypothetical protein [Deltaproteobacteria bacterium]